jgi:nicotinamidase-related amidase
MSYVAARAVFSPTDSTSPLSVSPSETVLLLIDYQNIAVGRLGDAAPSVLGVARQMRDWALFKGMPVYHCLVDMRPGITQPPARNKLSAKWRMYEDKFVAVPGLGFEADVLAPVDPGWEKTLLRTPGIMSALESQHGSTRLTDELVSRSVKSLMVCGLVTSGCVLSTARAAADQGFIVTVVEDGCFDPVPGLHGMLCAHVLPMSAHVATAGEIRDAWKVL